MSNHKPFPVRLTEYRNQNKINNERLSELSGIPKNKITRYMNGKEFPSSFAAEQLCMALRVSKKDLLGSNYYPSSGPHQIEMIVTKHAKDRFRERGVDGVYIRNQLSLFPYKEGEHKWYIPKTELFVAYVDTGEWRVLLTAGKDAKHVRVPSIP